MAPKRSHSAYEVDSQATEPLGVRYGTPVRIGRYSSYEGKYVPIHKQEVRDSHGKRRLHGAFMGGWVAG